MTQAFRRRARYALMRSRCTALVAVTLAALVSTAGLVPASAARGSRYAIETSSGDLVSYVNDYVGRNPGRGSNSYEVPSSRARASMSDAWRAVINGDLQKAADLAGPLGYGVVRYTDVATNIQVVLLAERRTVDGVWDRGWGLFGWAPTNEAAMIVEVAHPVADVDTEDMGVVAFRAASARGLLVAGAHRYANVDGAADVAHRTDSVFHAVHDLTLTAAPDVLQPHGYADSTVEHDVVVSRGAAPSTVTIDVDTALDGIPLDSCLYDGAECAELAGTRNVQGASTRAGSGDFVHLEVARRVRNDASARDAVVVVAATTVASAAAR